jgi:indolepyruvate ferredoxin oxidoreductase
MTLAAVSLDDKYALETGRVFLTGTQALVRLPIMQRRRDAAAGLRTGGFISGYRGSPLGIYDKALWQARRFLDQNDIHFRPGVNEDLAATSIWGTQQLNLFERSGYDGVFGIWYGKGPGVDRCGDALRHANLAGSAACGGVLLLLGDDHAAKSSTTAHQSDYAMADPMIPVLSPAGVQEFLDLGLHGIALSRYAGTWCGFKCVTMTIDSSATVHVDPDRIEIVTPSDFEIPEGGLNIRWPDDRFEQERRLHQHKLPAARAYARANRLDRIVFDSPHPRIGIVTAGKSYLDVMEAFEELGIDSEFAAALGLRVYKVALVWPLEREGLRRFADGLEEIVVVEEKRGLIEDQIKAQFYNLSGSARPARVVGKRDEDGAVLFPPQGELTAQAIARVLGERLARLDRTGRLGTRLAALAPARAAQASSSSVVRVPYFCSGCPHNTSTKVPEGSRALAGIGCHFLAQFMDRNTATFTPMGAEGVTWIGQAPFADTRHVFVNLGDGTYFHSGLLAIRAAIAAGANMTYKILYNDAVAMTGGQPIDGALSVQQITVQVFGEGVRRIAVVSDEPTKYPLGAGFAPGTTFHHRRELDAVQRELREREGVTVLIYDQVCAAEKRRRRKRGRLADPARHAVVNELVCEGCGDCSVVSNCVSIEPLETEFGRKRRINQSTCNKDFSCIDGFCPSLVTIEGGELRRSLATTGDDDRGDGALEALEEPSLPVTERPYNIIVTGVGGTGVVTIGALLGMAAHLEGKGCTVLDNVGLAQKGGAVLSHIRIAPKPEDIRAVAIGGGAADLLLGCDLVVAAGSEALAKVAAGRTSAVVNSHQTPVAGFIRDPDLDFAGAANRTLVAEATGETGALFVEATELATALFGDSIATNTFMLGLAYQRGLVPVSGAAIERAIELNGVAVTMNRRAFAWGRLAAVEPDRVAAEAARLAPRAAEAESLSRTLDEVVARRVAYLTDYQDAAYAERYAALVARVREAEAARVPGEQALATAVARGAFRLMAYKDEYEVARLHSDGRFLARLGEAFAGDWRVVFHMAPPLLARRDRRSGRLRKKSFGRWVIPLLKLLAGLRRLRGTPFDPFGHTAERRGERRLIGDYFAAVEALLAGLEPSNHALAVEIAALPERIRGFGHVKAQSVAQAKAEEARLTAAFCGAPEHLAAE